MKLTFFIKNFDDFIKYNSSRVNLFRNYIYTQYDAGNIIGYELTVENIDSLKHVFTANECIIRIISILCIIRIICVMRIISTIRIIRYFCI